MVGDRVYMPRVDTLMDRLGRWVDVPRTGATIVVSSEWRRREARPTGPASRSRSGDFVRRRVGVLGFPKSRKSGEFERLQEKGMQKGVFLQKRTASPLGRWVVLAAGFRPPGVVLNPLGGSAGSRDHR